jgi:predicted transcriptional regulator
MEILEVLLLSPTPLPITIVLRKVGIKHIKAKKLLESMVQIEWIATSFSDSKDDRFGDLFSLTKKGKEILSIYQKQIREFFFQLGKQ